MKYFKYCTFIVFLILVCSCSSPITYKDNGKTISLTEDDPLIIILEGDVDSDFEWKLNTDLQFVKLENPVAKMASVDTETYTFNLKTVSDGEDKIQFIYTDGNTIAKTFEVNIIVGSMGLIESE